MPKEIVDLAYTRFPGIGQNRIEIQEFAKMVFFSDLQNVLEIGTQYGGTFYIWCKLFENKKISIDLPLGVHGGLKESEMESRNSIFKDEFPNDKIHFVQADSHVDSTLKQVESILNGEKLDLLFIDGDHSYEGVKKDFHMYKHLVKNGGIIGIHDINKMEDDPTCTVYKFWEELEGNKYEMNCKCSWAKPTVVGGFASPILGGIGVYYK